MNKDYKAFSLKSENILTSLKTPVRVSSTIEEDNEGKQLEWTALWDTGATNSSISRKIAQELNLISVGQITLATANGLVDVNSYFVNIELPNNVVLNDVFVSESDLMEGIDLLLGMDVIQTGDFSISNLNQKTTFTFRIPSVEEIDFVEDWNNKQKETFTEPSLTDE